MSDKKHTLVSSSLAPLLFLLSIWAVFYVDTHYHLNLYQYGLKPRTFEGLIGIVTMPLLHSGFWHIVSNTFPMLILGTFLFYYYKEIAYKVFFISYLSSGILVWLFASFNTDTAVHIGASGLVYALAGFLFFSGIIRKNPMLFGVTLLVTFLYGTIIWGVLPIEVQKAIHFIENKENVSWEGHLFGFLSGTVLAYVYRKTGLKQPTYSWEINNDADVDETNPYWMETEADKPIAETPQQDVFKNTSDNPYTVHYTFIPKKEEGKE